MIARLRLSLIVPLIAAPILATGCRPGPGASEGAPSAGYRAMTSGSPEALLDHLQRLKARMHETDPGDLRAFRAGLLAYTDAIVQTADALLADHAASGEQRREAATAELSALSRRAEVDPKAHERFLAAADRLEREPVDSGIRPIAAYQRFKVIAEATPGVGEIKAANPQFDRLLEAATRLGRADPVHPEAGKILLDFAMGCEQRQLDGRALELYDLLAERFADDPSGRSAAATARRLRRKGQPAEDLAGPALDGSATIDLKSYRGKVVLVDFWATWCGPCVKEMPALKDLRERLGPRGFEILGVSLDHTAAEAQVFLKTRKYAWPQIFEAPAEGSDPGTTPLALKFGTPPIPLKLLIDRDGRLVASGHALEEVEPALDERFPRTEPDSKK